VLRAFQLFDKDRDGRLRATEVRGALKQLVLPASAAEAEGVLRGFDRDGDGGLDAREFHRLVLRVQAFQRRPAPPAATTATTAATAAAAPPPPPPPTRVEHLTSVQLCDVLRARGHAWPPEGSGLAALVQLCRERGVNEVSHAELARLAAARKPAPTRASAAVAPVARPTAASPARAGAPRADGYVPMASSPSRATAAPVARAAAAPVARAAAVPVARAATAASPVARATAAAAPVARAAASPVARATAAAAPVARAAASPVARAVASPTIAGSHAQGVRYS
jgi:hypothetical protein